jgi:hypothetical protein
VTRAFKYTMLMASLPLHPADLLSARQPPVSRIQLDKRLALLDKHDREELESIEQMIFWSHARDASSEEIIAQDNAALAMIKNPFLKHLVLWRLTTRTLVSGLRLRHAGFTPPNKNSFIGFGKWLPAIAKNWERPDFGINPIEVPWLAKANEFIVRNQPLELEKLLLTMSWRYYAKLSNQHTFDFEAVVIYVMRWDVINRWSHYNRDYFKETALANFNKLVDASLSGCPTSF